MKITISKSQWEEMGKTAGWKVAMPLSYKPDPSANLDEELNNIFSYIDQNFSTKGLSFALKKIILPRKDEILKILANYLSQSMGQQMPQA